MPDPREIGARVLEGAARGRQVALAARQAAARDLLRLVRAAATRDAETHHGPRGRAERIARRLQGLVTARHVRRLLTKYPDTEGVMSELLVQTQSLSKQPELTHVTKSF